MQKNGQVNALSAETSSSKSKAPTQITVPTISKTTKLEQLVEKSVFYVSQIATHTVSGGNGSGYDVRTAQRA